MSSVDTPVIALPSGSIHDVDKSERDATSSSAVEAANAVHNDDSSHKNEPLDSTEDPECDLDDDFDAFMKEVESDMKVTKAPVRPTRVTTSTGLVVTLGDAKSQIKRLKSKTYTNFFEVLQLPPDASEADIKAQYRKLSQMLHPDKCKLEGAGDAFQLVNKANAELQKPEYRTKYLPVLEEAKRKVQQRHDDEDAKRRRLGKPGLPPMDPQEFSLLVTQECNTLLETAEKARAYASSVKLTNEKREQDMLDMARMEEEKGVAMKRQRENTMHERTAGWASFQQSVGKKQKTFGSGLGF